MKRTDVIIDFKGVQFVLEMKIYHGQEYNRRGENQLLEYMDYYRLQKGYMLSFNLREATSQADVLAHPFGGAVCQWHTFSTDRSEA